MEDELIVAIPPHLLAKDLQGLEALSRNGLRYPIPNYGVSNEARAGMGITLRTLNYPRILTIFLSTYSRLCRLIA